LLADRDHFLQTIPAVVDVLLPGGQQVFLAGLEDVAEAPCTFK